MRWNHPRRWLVAAATTAILTLAAGGATLSGALGSAALAAPGDPAPAAMGCGKAPTLTSEANSVQSSGMNRSYNLKIPDNYDSNHQYRLIFAFHWVGGTANDVSSGGTDGDVWAYYGLKQLSDNSAILVAPQGINNGWANGGDQDVTFIDDMIKQIEGDLCVNTAQLFAVGFSYGGSMTYALACSRATVFRAVAVYSGAQMSGCSNGTQPIAYLGIHGIGDPILNIAGGRALRDTFVRNNGCAPQDPPEPAPGSQTHIVTSYQGCQPGHPVEWAAFDGGHLPGQVDGGGESGFTTWTKTAVWQFFSQF
jgi:poly(3-hydroxybutyrate) depolymerase